MSSELEGGAGHNRRDFLKRAAVTGAIAVPATGLLTSCATSGGGNKKAKSGAKSKKNPLGVNATAPLDVFIFKGGYSDTYAIDDEKIYAKAFPKAKITHTGTQGLAQKLQPRFVGGNPPDAIDNSGDSNLDVATLIGKNQITDLTRLLDAPAYDIPGKTVRDTLLPGVLDSGTFSGKPYILYYVYTLYGLWHSKPLFDKNGWDVPTNWDEMLALCPKIRKAGMYPWTFQGKFPIYILWSILGSATKMGGVDVLKNLDNLQPNAWKDPAIKASAEYHAELVAKKYVLPGTPGLTHTQSQTYWAQGKAAFIPCGSWLENELGKITPTGFDMVVTPMLSMKSDKLPDSAIQAAGTEGFIVPQQGKNPQGGLEFLRIMLSKQASTNFSKLTHALTSVSGYAENLNYSTAFTSARDLVTAAGKDAFTWNFNVWYAQMEKSVEDATGELMAGRIKPDEWVTRCQKAADTTAKDSSIKKYHRA